MTWGEAYEYCWNLNARLLEFDTELQMKELNLIIENESVKHNNWIGATDFGSEGTFKWIESGQDVGNFSWHPGAGFYSSDYLFHNMSSFLCNTNISFTKGQPEGGSRENCMWWSSGDYAGHDFSCTSHNYPMCQIVV